MFAVAAARISHGRMVDCESATRVSRMRNSATYMLATVAAKPMFVLIAPLIGMRRRLQSFGPEGDALGKPSDAVVGKLRENHRNPDAHPWATLSAEVRAIADSIRASQWATDPAIAVQLTKIDEIIAEHDAALAE